MYTIAALASFVGLAFAVSTGRAMAFDNSIRLAVRAFAAPELTTVLRFLTLFGEMGVLPALSALAMGVLLCFGQRREAAVFVVSMLGGLAIDPTLKLAFHRSRPPEAFFGTPVPSSYSFPSGHALYAVFYFGSLAVLVSPHLRRRSSRLALWIAAGIMALAIGYSRVYLGVHYPSDVLAGYAAGCAWIAGAVPFLREYGQWRKTNPSGSKSS